MDPSQVPGWLIVRDEQDALRKLRAFINIQFLPYPVTPPTLAELDMYIRVLEEYFEEKENE